MIGGFVKVPRVVKRVEYCCVRGGVIDGTVLRYNRYA